MNAEFLKRDVEGAVPYTQNSNFFVGQGLAPAVLEVRTD